MLPAHFKSNQFHSEGFDELEVEDVVQCHINIIIMILSTLGTRSEILGRGDDRLYQFQCLIGTSLIEKMNSKFSHG